MGRLEFFISHDLVWYRTEEGVMMLEENSDVVDDMFGRISNFYPNAFNALVKHYEKSKLNPRYFKFLCVRRFCKCNFGELDTTKDDVDVEGIHHFEKVRCPLRGECVYEGCICLPKFNTSLTEAEQRVMRRVYEGMSVSEIADDLYNSPNTIKNHIKSVYAKLNIHSNVEFVKYANDNNLFQTN